MFVGNSDKRGEVLNFTMPYKHIVKGADWTTSDTDTYASYTVPQSWADEVYMFQVAQSGTLAAGPRILETANGNQINYPTLSTDMTSNAGTDLVMKLCADEETRPDAAGLAEALHPELLNTFKPAFLGRVTLVPYFPLTDDVLRKIVKLQMDRIARRVEENHRAKLTYDDSLLGGIASRCTEVESGARNVDHILTRTLLPELSAEVLSRMAAEEAIGGVHVTMGEDGGFRYEFR